MRKQGWLGGQHAFFVTPETGDEVGEPGVFVHDVVNERQRSKELELRHEHESQRRRRSAIAGVGWILSFGSAIGGRQRVDLLETKECSRRVRRNATQHSIELGEEQPCLCKDLVKHAVHLRLMLDD